MAEPVGSLTAYRAPANNGLTGEAPASGPQPAVEVAKTQPVTSTSSDQCEYRPAATKEEALRDLKARFRLMYAEFHSRQQTHNPTGALEPQAGEKKLDLAVYSGCCPMMAPTDSYAWDNSVFLRGNQRPVAPVLPGTGDPLCVAPLDLLKVSGDFTPEDLAWAARLMNHLQSSITKPDRVFGLKLSEQPIDYDDVPSAAPALKQEKLRARAEFAYLLSELLLALNDPNTGTALSLRPEVAQAREQGATFWPDPELVLKPELLQLLEALNEHSPSPLRR